MGRRTRFGDEDDDFNDGWSDESDEEASPYPTPHWLMHVISNTMHCMG